MPRKKDGGACRRCRAHHLKCDEQRPGCVRCATSNIQCPGYFQETKFLDQGAGLRRKFHYGEDRAVLGEGSPSPGRISEDSPGLAVVLDKNGNGSCRLTRCIAQDGTNEGSEKTSNETSGGELRSTTVPPFVNGRHVAEVEEAASGDASIPTLRGSVEDYDSIPDMPETPGVTVESFGTEQLQFNGESVSENLQAVFPSTSRPSSQITQPQEASSTELEDAFEVLFLIRRFSETVGPWLDLYDQGNYFSTMIPVEATSCTLLRYAACAIAAKQLGRVKGKKATAGGICTQPAATECFPDVENTAWCYIAANYYDKAITCLQEALVKNVAQQCLWTCNPDQSEVL